MTVRDVGLQGRKDPIVLEWAAQQGRIVLTHDVSRSEDSFLPEIKLLGHVSLPEVQVPGKPNRGGGPAWITFTPDSKTVYVSTCGTKSVTAIDVKTMKEVARIPVGEVPDRISTLVLP